MVEFPKVGGLHRLYTRLFPTAADRIGSSAGKFQIRERLGGLLKSYHRKASENPIRDFVQADAQGGALAG